MRNFIFIWFLGAVLLIGLAGVASAIWTGPYFVLATWNFYGADLVQYGAQGAVNALQRGGVPALDDFEKQMSPDGRMRGYVFDSQFHEVRGRQVPDSVRKLAGELREDAPIRFEPDGRRVLAGSLVRVSGEGAYRIVMAFASRRAPGVTFNSWGWMVRFAMILISALLLCSWLAWRLSQPLSRLRQVTRNFAAGDLTTRAGASSFPKHPPEYGELARDFDEMAQRIEILVNSQRRLLRDVSHELRTPLTRLGLAVNIARHAQGVPAAETLDRIDRESDRLNALIERILRLSRIESLDKAPHRELIECSDFIHSIVSDANFEAEAYHRKVSAVRSETCLLHGDRELLREAIENVIRNAIRYTPESTSVVVESYLAGNSEYRIVVRDRGPGVPSGEVAAIFDPFHRASQDGDAGGFGLGLAIAKRAVDLHRGVITARNCSSGGFEVAIELPFERA